MLKTSSFPKHSRNLKNKCAYSINWAANVVYRFEKQHARATDKILEVWGISENDLAKFLSFGDPFWMIFKYMVKALERETYWEHDPESVLVWLSKSVLSDLLSGCWPSLDDFQRKRYFNRLTERIKAL